MEETLEEVSEKIYPPRITWIKSFAKVESEAFKKGAKWQQERSYSEEEVLNLLWKLYTTPNYMANFDTKADLIEWFEQFKKK